MHAVNCLMVGQSALIKYQIPHYGHRGFDITVFYYIIQVVGQGAKVCCQVSHYSPTCAQGEYIDRYIHNIHG